MQGTAERPRLNVYRSLNHIYVQLIDDSQGVTLVSANSAEGKKGKTAHWRQSGGGQGGRQVDCRAGARPKGLRRWYSIVAATCTMGGSRPWPMRRAKPD